MLNVRVSGKGESIVFLHGFCEDLRIWDTFAPLFEDDFRVCCVDLPGFGKSLPLNDDLSTWASSCFEALDSLQITDFSLIGHSMGGYLAMAMMEQAPERMRCFVSFHSSPLADTEEKKLNRLRQVAIVQERGVRALVDPLIPTLFKPDYEGIALDQSLKIAREQSAGGIAAALRAMRTRPDRTRVIRTFEAPVLVLSGRYDAILSIDGQKDFALLAQKGEHAILEDSGHMGMLEEPARSYDRINRFLMDINCS